MAPREEDRGMADPRVPHAQLSREAGRFAFGTDAVGYHQARTGYPPELYDHVFVDLPDKPDILEIGAGTGLVTEEFLRRDPRSILIVEPDAALARFTADRLADPRLDFLVAPFPDVQVDGHFDLIACAAAFHWMEPAPALKRVRQLLRPSGIWAVWWNSYRNAGRGDPLADAISPLLDGVALPPSDTIDRHYSLDEEFHRKLLLDAGFSYVEHHCYRTERELTTAQVVKLFASYSYIRALSADRRERFLGSLADLVDSQFGGLAPNLILTSMYLARG